MHTNKKAGVSLTSSIKQKIASITKNTIYHKTQTKKFQTYSLRIQKIKSQLLSLSECSKTFTKTQINSQIKKTEKKFYKSPEKFFMYIDIDMFYVAVELLENPQLREKPVMIGNSIISASNYIARKFGVRSGMATFVAKKLCPDLVVLKTDLKKYKRFSDMVYEVVREFDPGFRFIGLDEAVMDVGNYMERFWGELREEVMGESGERFFEDFENGNFERKILDNFDFRVGNLDKEQLGDKGFLEDKDFYDLEDCEKEVTGDCFKNGDFVNQTIFNFENDCKNDSNKNIEEEIFEGLKDNDFYDNENSNSFKKLTKKEKREKYKEEKLLNLILYKIINRLKTKIFKKTGLTVSAGIAPNRLLAKLSSEEKKPNGEFVLRKNKKKIYNFLNKKKIIKIPGIGPSTEFLLKGLDIFTTYDLRENLFIIKKFFSEKLFFSLLNKSIGFEDCEEIYKDSKNPSFYKSKTFTGTNNLEFFKNVILELSENLEKRLKEKKLKARKICVDVKYFDFKVFSKSKNFGNYIDEKKQFFETGFFLLKSIIEKKMVRKIGLKISDFLNSEKKSYFENKNLDENKNLKEKNEGRISLNFSDGKKHFFNKTFCPVCQKSFDFKGNNATLNRHINNCLDSKNFEKGLKESFSSNKKNKRKRKSSKKRFQNKSKKKKIEKKDEIKIEKNEEIKIEKIDEDNLVIKIEEDDLIIKNEEDNLIIKNEEDNLIIKNEVEDSEVENFKKSLKVDKERFVSFGREDKELIKEKEEKKTGKKIKFEDYIFKL